MFMVQETDADALAYPAVCCSQQFVPRISWPGLHPTCPPTLLLCESATPKYHRRKVSNSLDSVPKNLPTALESILANWSTSLHFTPRIRHRTTSGIAQSGIHAQNPDGRQNGTKSDYVILEITQRARHGRRQCNGIIWRILKIHICFRSVCRAWSVCKLRLWCRILNSAISFWCGGRRFAYLRKHGSSGWHNDGGWRTEDLRTVGVIRQMFTSSREFGRNGFRDD